jgi:outer membrane protein TolC
MRAESLHHEVRSAARCARALVAAACLFAAIAAFAQVPAPQTTQALAPATQQTSPDQGPLTFREAVQLALQHSGIMGIATMNQWRSMKAYQEVKNHYLPQFTVGSGLGYSYGFPLTLEGSAPSVVNFTSSQAIFSLSLKHYLKAAKIDWQAQSFDVQEKRNAVLLDVALTYEQLSTATSKLATLQKAQEAADQAQFITQQRVKEGVDSQLELTRSQLVAARIRLRSADAEAQRDVLREHLSRLVGLPAAELNVDAESIPELPQIFQEDDYSARAVENSPAVRLAQQHAFSADERAKAEHRATLPTADLASQYAYLARFNNYDQYYLKYNANNLSAGLNLRFPFFNPVQKAHAQQADADAIIAHKQADLTKDQVSENALKLQRSLKQLQAARDVAKLEWQVSIGELNAVAGRMQIGGANLRDQENAQLDANDKYAAYLDAEFELSRAELQLLRIAGELENWAVPSP